MASNETQQPCHFFALPVEIQDMIFELAYPMMNAKIIFKCDWQEEQDDLYKKDRTNYVPAAFPDYKVSEFVVSKKFFVGAARAYIGAQHWTDDTTSTLLADQCGLFHEYARHISLPDTYLVGDAAKCPRLASLDVELDAYDFDDMRRGLHMWEDICQGSDFEGLETTTQLLRLTRVTSLKSLKFTAARTCSLFANTAAKEQMWQDNVGRYQEYICKQLDQHKEPLADRMNQEPGGPLYMKSRVCFDSKVLLPEGTPLPGSLSAVTGSLADSDIPETQHELLEMVKQRGPEFVAWIQRAKTALAVLDEKFGADEDISDQE
ncbi:hypothetical protein LTR56_027841 [Elasticomyces elasticus]|nr:hypothetical protein LTR56_027841 [Elasticomyces elasticus]KAK3614037.1 hypothetical protein LTR22_027918 [Elasticomyces elasticus]KAK4911819.1 hypothetical protein LTR49_019619 [Elasticomyces elasticus]KAK5727831.1 hypothetical protein LTS12_027404 [Elasticomyces elasticus]